MTATTYMRRISGSRIKPSPRTRDRGSPTLAAVIPTPLIRGTDALLLERPRAAGRDEGHVLHRAGTPGGENHWVRSLPGCARLLHGAPEPQGGGARPGVRSRGVVRRPAGALGQHTFLANLANHPLHTNPREQQF